MTLVALAIAGGAALLAATCRQRALPRHVESRALGGQLRVDPRHLILVQEYRQWHGAVLTTRRLWERDRQRGRGGECDLPPASTTLLSATPIR
ncbi:MAG: hypothetical protein FJX74_19155 [Armatimonadetes bacterium]|nr:hypothetical protein [Armatimonadota bacterium]